MLLKISRASLDVCERKAFNRILTLASPELPLPRPSKPPARSGVCSGSRPGTCRGRCARCCSASEQNPQPTREEDCSQKTHLTHSPGRSPLPLKSKAWCGADCSYNVEAHFRDSAPSPLQIAKPGNPQSERGRFWCFLGH